MPDSVREPIPSKCFLHGIVQPTIVERRREDFLYRWLFKPRKDSEDCFLDLPIDWEALEKKSDRNWRMCLQGWTMFHPIMAFFDSLDSQEMLSATRYFFSVINDWWTSYRNDRDDVLTTRMPESYAWYDMSVGFRSLALGFFADRIACYGITLSDDQRQLLDGVIGKHIRHLSCERVFSLNNHGIFQMHGLMALLKLYGGVGDPSLIDYAVKRMEELLLSQFDENGIHREHSPHYHFFVLKSFEMVRDTGWYSASSLFESILRQATAAKKWLVHPDKRTVCIGDSLYSPQELQAYPDSISAYEISDFYDSGYAIVRSNWGARHEEASMLFFTGAYHSKSHKHRDCLSFEWFEGGRRILVDSGKYGYKSDAFRKYALSYRAHNTVEIEGFDILSMKPYGSILSGIEPVGSDVFSLHGAIELKAISHGRTIYFKPGCWVVIRDDLEFARARSYSLWFHLAEQFYPENLSGSTVSFIDSKCGRRLLMSSSNSGLKRTLHRGDEGPPMQGFMGDQDYKFYPNTTIGYHGRGKHEAVFTTIALSNESLRDSQEFLAAVDERFHSAEILNGVEHEVLAPAPRFPLSKGIKTYSYVEGDCRLEFYANIRDKKSLVVMLPGATSRRHGHRDFQRYTWAEEFPDSDIIAFSDPTIKNGNKLTIGWFQNSEETFGVNVVSRLIDKLITAHHYKESETLIWGSSAGGFTALKLGEVLDKVSVLAINPQLFLYNYQKVHYDALLASVYGGMAHQDVLRSFKDRIVVSNAIAQREGRTVIIQNESDTRHVLRHLRPFLKGVDTNQIQECRLPSEGTCEALGRSLTIAIFNDPSLAHAPPRKQETIEYISTFFPSLCRPLS